MYLKKLVGIFIMMLLIVTSFSGLGMISEYNPLDGGWLEEIDGVKILHVSGSNYDMGYQHGYLLKDDIDENAREFQVIMEELNITLEDLLAIWDMMKEYVPQEYINETQGLADGSGYTFEEVIVAQIYIELMSCCGMAAWGPATQDGKLIHVRSGDVLGLFYSDPVTGNYSFENQVLVVRKPDNGYASLYPIVAGILFEGSGMNEKGISLGMKASFSDEDHIFSGEISKLKTNFMVIMNTYDDIIQEYYDSIFKESNNP
jgi:hypothetical protein